MNNKIIFDASAVVALLAKEKGFEVINWTFDKLL